MSFDRYVFERNWFKKSCNITTYFTSFEYDHEELKEKYTIIRKIKSIKSRKKMVSQLQSQNCKLSKADFLFKGQIHSSKLSNPKIFIVSQKTALSRKLVMNTRFPSQLYFSLVWYKK